MEIFETCREINDLLNTGKEHIARNLLIRLLDFHTKNGLNYSPVVNHLIRRTGLYPYLQHNTADWQDRFIHEAFKVDTGELAQRTLHREQSLLLKKLLSGANIAVSAPTSFGKSFVIDAFISLTKPKNAVIIVPTIALTDETRRRIQRKFSNEYKIITTSDVQISNKNIFIFPQERAINYINKIDSIDILIIDEFYKASHKFDKERAPALINAILQLGRKSKQKYFLAPNVTLLKQTPITEDMEFVHINFNTVYTEKHDLYKEIKGIEQKNDKLIEILTLSPAKTLIYAGTYGNINHITNLLSSSFDELDSYLLKSFAEWLEENYSKEYKLIQYIRKGTGIHNGRLHRSLSQIQVKLFEEKSGINNIVSTSSIIEGVNTSAENVIIWENKNGRPKLNDFTYKNIIGRGGRMFRHFIGKIFILDEPPKEEETTLSIDFTDHLLSNINEDYFERELTREQLAKIIAFKNEMSEFLGNKYYKQLVEGNVFQLSNSELLLKITKDIHSNPKIWHDLEHLNYDNHNKWEKILYRVLKLGGSFGTEHRTFVSFIKIISNNWTKSLPDILNELKKIKVDIDSFFELERNATFKLATLLNDINHLQKALLKEKEIDISPFVSRLSHAFLPPLVYELEEYGLPRMISRKIHYSNAINFESSMSIHSVISLFNAIGKNKITSKIKNIQEFDYYIIDYFYEGISYQQSQETSK